MINDRRARRTSRERDKEEKKHRTTVLCVPHHAAWNSRKERGKQTVLYTNDDDDDDDDHDHD